MKISRRKTLAMLASSVAMPYVRPARAEDKVVNVYSWAEYIGETTLVDFEKETGIHAVYDTYASYEDCEAKLLAGSTNYDVVDVSGKSVPMLSKAGVLTKLDRSRFPGWDTLDPDLLNILMTWDPGLDHGTPYMWGSVGFTYNLDEVKKVLPGAELDDLGTILKPENAAKLATCGLSLVDSPNDVIPMVLKYLGIDPDSAKPEDYDKVVAAISAIRSYITTFDSEQYLNGLPNGDVCAANTWSGDYVVASTRAAAAGLSVNLAYHVPKTGAPLWFDVMVIPQDAPHKDNAYAFLNYLMKPEVIAKCTNFIGYANANKASLPFIDPAIANNPAVYPDAETRKRMWAPKPLSPENEKAMISAWQKIKSG